MAKGQKWQCLPNSASPAAAGLHLLTARPRSFVAARFIPHAVAASGPPAAEEQQQQEVLSHSVLEEAGLEVTVRRSGGRYTVDLRSPEPRPGLMLHWAVNDWSPPPKEAWPPGSRAAGDKAVETEFKGGAHLSLSFCDEDSSGASAPTRVVFVLRQGDNWINRAGGGDFAAHLKQPGAAGDEVHARSRLSRAHWLTFFLRTLHRCVRQGAGGRGHLQQLGSL